MQFITSFTSPIVLPERERLHELVVHYRNGDKEVYRSARILQSAASDLFISFFGNIIHLQKVDQWKIVDK